MARRRRDNRGDADAGGHFLLRHRIVFLSILLCVLSVVVGGAAMVAVQQGASPRDAALIAVGAILAAGCAMIYTRHLALSCLVAAAPLPGLIWAAPLNAGATFEGVPALAYAFAYAVAMVHAQGILVHALDGSKTENPYRQAAAAVGLLAVLALLWFRRTDVSPAGLQAVVDAGLATVSVLLLVPIGASFMHFDEAFVVEANRARERHLRPLEKIAMVAVPRWGVSIAGIALVFIALGIFESWPAVAALHFFYAPILIVVSALAVFLFGLVLCGGWREGLAAVVVAILVSLMALWGCAVVGTTTAVSLVCIFEIVPLTMFLVFCWGARAIDYRRYGNDLEIARLRAVEDTGAAQAFAVVGGIAMLLPGLIIHPIYAAYAVALLFAGAGGLAFAPACATAIEAILPRPRPTEDVYINLRRR